VGAVEAEIRASGAAYH